MFSKLNVISSVALAAVVTFAMGTTVFMPEVAVAGAVKVDVCHIPPDDPDNFHTITISEKALEPHLAHGDVGGECPSEPEPAVCPCFDATALQTEFEVSGESLSFCGIYDGSHPFPFNQVSDGEFVLYNNFSLACSGDTGTNCTSGVNPDGSTYELACAFATGWNGGGWDNVFGSVVTPAENTECRALLQQLCESVSGLAPETSATSASSATTLVPSVVD